MSKVTAETITDEQIASVIDLGNEILRVAHEALDTSRSGRDARMKARERCAKIWNARTKEPRHG